MNVATGGKRAKFSSWIPGVPLASILSNKRRLTVDLTPVTLADFRRWFGISPEAFIAFAEAGILIVNIRDFDPEGDAAAVQAELYAIRDTEGFLPRLFSRASRHVYFVSTLRDQLFDPLLGKGHGLLRRRFAEAAGLRAAAAAAQAFDVHSMEVTRALFRGEAPHLTAVKWHWAYVNAMRRFLDQINSEIYPNIRWRYDQLVSGETETPGVDYLMLATQLRYAHLLASAPMSAAFGGTFNFLLDVEAQFLQAVRSGAALADYDYMTDALLDLIHGLQVGRLPRHLELAIPDRYRRPLSRLGVQVYVRYNHISHFDHYQDVTHQKQLIEYVLHDDGLESRFDDIDREIESFRSNPPAKMTSKSIATVAHIAAEAGATIQRRGDALRKITRMHQGIEPPSPELVSLPATPVYATNPREANLLMSLTDSLKDNNAPLGLDGDADWRTIWFPKIFRQPPR